MKKMPNIIIPWTYRIPYSTYSTSSILGSNININSVGNTGTINTSELSSAFTFDVQVHSLQKNNF